MGARLEVPTGEGYRPSNKRPTADWRGDMFSENFRKQCSRVPNHCWPVLLTNSTPGINILIQTRNLYNQNTEDKIMAIWDDAGGGGRQTAPQGGRAPTSSVRPTVGRRGRLDRGGNRNTRRCGGGRVPHGTRQTDRREEMGAGRSRGRAFRGGVIVLGLCGTFVAEPYGGGVTCH